jgi:hypothetical protein
MTNNQSNKKIGECEVCPKTEIEISVHYGNLWMCDKCWSKELALKTENDKPENVASRIEATRHNPIESKLIETSKAIDNSIQVRTDLFNAATVAIMDIKKSIDDNTEIQNKPYTLATTLLERFNHYKQVVFELNEQIIEAGNQQKAIQVYLNQLANSLRAEERAELKIADISYKPQPPKSTSVKTIKTTSKSKKFDKVELRKYAAELGVAEFTLQSFVVSQGLTVAEAADKIRKSIAAAKSQS